MARFGTKKYSHTNRDLVVSHAGDNRIHLSGGENGTSGVAVVGIGGGGGLGAVHPTNRHHKRFKPPPPLVCFLTPLTAQ